MPTQAEVHPCWRGGSDQIPGMARIQAAGRVRSRDPTSQRFVRIWLTIENGNGHKVEQILPISPFRQLQQIIRPDQPDKSAVSVAFQSSDRIHTILRTKLSFQIRDKDFRVSARHVGGGGHAFGKASHIIFGFQGVLRRDQPPDTIETEPLDGVQADRAMPFMGGIEGAAEQADTRHTQVCFSLPLRSLCTIALGAVMLARKSKPRHRTPACDAARGAATAHAGRVCPVPRT